MPGSSPASRSIRQQQVSIRRYLDRNATALSCDVENRESDRPWRHFADGVAIAGAASCLADFCGHGLSAASYALNVAVGDRYQ